MNKNNKLKIILYICCSCFYFLLTNDLQLPQHSLYILQCYYFSHNQHHVFYLYHYGEHQSYFVKSRKHVALHTCTSASSPVVWWMGVGWGPRCVFVESDSVRAYYSYFYSYTDNLTHYLLRFDGLQTTLLVAQQIRIAEIVHVTFGLVHHR